MIEARIYEKFDASNSDLAVPCFIGLFADDKDIALAISDEGLCLHSFAEVAELAKCVSHSLLYSPECSTQPSRTQLFRTLTLIHQLGILHNDFSPRNVVCGPRGYIIMDFSHSSEGHHCLGIDTCGELLDALHQLWGPEYPAHEPEPKEAFRDDGSADSRHTATSAPLAPPLNARFSQTLLSHSSWAWCGAVCTVLISGMIGWFHFNKDSF